MSAIISPCQLYRYRLDREFLLAGPTIAFILHNPSTADASIDDPTLRRGIGFARAWGAGRLVFVNPWAGRATRPADLWHMVDPVGPENDHHLATVAAEVRETDGFFVLGWGSVSPPRHRREQVSARLSAVIDLLISSGCSLNQLGLTKDGQPRHPLYLRKDLTPQPWVRR